MPTGSLSVKLFFVLVTYTGSAFAQQIWGDIIPDYPRVQKNPRSALSTTRSSDAVLPHLAIGGYWSTTLTVINLSPKPSKTVIDFYSQSGSRMVVSFSNDLGQTVSGNQITVVLQPRASMTLYSVPSRDLQIGWAMYNYVSSFQDSNYGGKAAVQAVFRSRVEGRPDYEASVLPDWGLDRNVAVPFDNTGGFDTSIAIAYSGSFSEQTMVVRIYDANGTLLNTRVETMPPLTQVAFETKNRWPETANRKGVIMIETTNYGLAAIALQFNPTGAFSTSTFYEYEK